MIILLDYGSGNLRSVAKAMESTGATVKITSDPHDLKAASHLVLPGVGAFGDCLANLQQAGLIDPMLEHIGSGKPFLGICVGMQLLFAVGEEFGLHAGLNLLPGRVVRFLSQMVDPLDANRHLKIPHMGWNAVTQTNPHALWANIPDSSYFYFVHSYYAVPENNHAMVGNTLYGTPFTSAVAMNNIFATQFHPEKSQKLGLQLLQNFVHWHP